MDATDALEAAKLAAAVGSQLKNIDKYSVERTSNPANKININSFIANVKNPRAKIGPAKYLVETPAGFAPPPPEDYVQSQVPDTSIGSLPVVDNPSPNITQQSIPVVIPSPNAPIHAHMPPQAPVIVPTSAEYTEAVNALKSIDKTLSDMLAYMKEKLSNE
jgi:hypothetical protein